MKANLRLFQRSNIYAIILELCCLVACDVVDNNGIENIDCHLSGVSAMWTHKPSPYPSDDTSEWDF